MHLVDFYSLRFQCLQRKVSQAFCISISWTLDYSNRSIQIKKISLGDTIFIAYNASLNLLLQFTWKCYKSAKRLSNGNTGGAFYNNRKQDSLCVTHSIKKMFYAINLIKYKKLLINVECWDKTTKLIFYWPHALCQSRFKVTLQNKIVRDLGKALLHHSRISRTSVFLCSAVPWVQYPVLVSYLYFFWWVCSINLLILLALKREKQMSLLLVWIMLVNLLYWITSGQKKVEIVKLYQL